MGRGARQRQDRSVGWDEWSGCRVGRGEVGVESWEQEREGDEGEEENAFPYSNNMLFCEICSWLEA